MQSKLTLRLDEELIRKAKAYARQSGRSLSRLVADYFAVLPGVVEETVAIESAPIARSLRGALKGKAVDRKDYRRHLEKKYR